MPRSSSSSKSGKSTRHSAASRDNDSDPIDETTARPRPGGKSRERVRDLAAVDESDLEEGPHPGEHREGRRITVRIRGDSEVTCTPTEERIVVGHEWASDFFSVFKFLASFLHRCVLV
jgi:hypothetical protein